MKSEYDKYIENLISNNLRVLRISRSLSISDVCRITGIKERVLSNVERGNRSLNIENMLKLAIFYGLSIDELLFGEEIPTVLKEPEYEDVDKYKQRMLLKYGLVFLNEEGKKIFLEVYNSIMKGQK